MSEQVSLLEELGALPEPTPTPSAAPAAPAPAPTEQQGAFSKLIGRARGKLKGIRAPGKRGAPSAAEKALIESRTPRLVVPPAAPPVAPATSAAASTETPPAESMRENQAPAPAGPVVPSEDRYDLAAAAYLAAGYSVADALFSGAGEWVPDDKSEEEGMRRALAAWLRARGSEDLPPGAAFAVAAAVYSAKRVRRPNTLTRIQTWGIWMRARFSAWRTARKLDAVTPAS